MRSRNAIGSPNSGSVRTIGQTPWLNPSFGAGADARADHDGDEREDRDADDADEHEGQDAFGTMLGDGAGVAHLSRIGQRAVTGRRGLLDWTDGRAHDSARPQT